jgi:cellulose synthase/poly-beta-1,6-N-acetylglucosamine synthase-like glycosyltransferase
MIELLLVLAITCAALDVLMILFTPQQKSSVGVFSAQKVPDNNKLVLILSVLNEEATIYSTLSFLKEHDDLFDEIIVVGSVRERINGVNKTLSLARTYFGPTATILECPDIGIKAHQLNFAVQAVQNKSNTWIYLMDIDTRFSRKMIHEIRELIDKGVGVIQSHSLFLLNYGKSWISSFSGCYQSRWTITHEIPRIWLRREFGIGVFHLVGHGLTINLDLLRKLGGFSERFEIEDIHLGFKASIFRVPVHSTHELENSDCPSQFREWWWQQFGWSKGVLQVHDYIKALKIQNPEVRIPWMDIISAYWNYLRWISNSPFQWGMAILVASHPAALIYWSLYVATCVLTWLRTSKGHVPLFAFIFFSIGYSFFRSAPVVHSFICSLLNCAPRRKYKSTHE